MRKIAIKLPGIGVVVVKKPFDLGHKCSKCDKDIKPGKPGRLCKECLTEGTTDVRN